MQGQKADVTWENFYPLAYRTLAEAQFQPRVDTWTLYPIDGHPAPEINFCRDAGSDGLVETGEKRCLLPKD